MKRDQKISVRSSNEVPWLGYSSANWMQPRFPEASTIGRLLRVRRRAANSYLHGWRHWRAVAAIGCKLAAETQNVDLGIVLLFSLFHDAERKSDGADPHHGERAARLVSEVGELLGLAINGEELLSAACRFHNKGMTTEDPTIGTCWDADRLTLPRVGIKPSNRFLSTSAAKQQELQSLGNLLSVDPPVWSEAIAPFRASFESIR